MVGRTHTGQPTLNHFDTLRWPADRLPYEYHTLQKPQLQHIYVKVINHRTEDGNLQAQRSRKGRLTDCIIQPTDSSARPTDMIDASWYHKTDLKID